MPIEDQDDLFPEDPFGAAGAADDEPAEQDDVTAAPDEDEGDPFAAAPPAAPAEEPEEEPRAAQAGVPRQVVKQLRAERRELREALTAREAELAAAAATAETLRQALAVIEVSDPGRVPWDRRFMDALEVMTKTDPAAARLAQAVIAHMEDPNMSTPTDFPNTGPRDTEPADAPVDARTDALYQRAASAHVKEALGDLKPGFQSLLTNIIVENQGDVLTLSAQELRTLAAGYARENGFKPAELLKSAEAEAPRGGRAPAQKPPIPRSSGASTPARKAAPPAAAKPGAEPPAPERPRTMQEILNRRGERVRQQLTDMGLI